MVDHVRNRINLRKIVGMPDPNESTLGQVTARGRINGVRSIAWLLPDGTTAADPKVGTPGVTTLGSLGFVAPDGRIYSGDALKPAQNTGGNKIDPADPESGGYSVDSGGMRFSDPDKSFEEIISEFKDIEGYRSGAGGVISPADGGGTLNFLEGAKDCATGQPLDVRLDGLAVPPPGWIDADTPENEWERWTPGVRWFASGSGGMQFGATPQQAAELARDTSGDDEYSDIGTVTKSTVPHAGGIIRFEFNFKNPALPPEDFGVNYSAFDEGCTQSEGDETCPIATPIRYPEDGKMQVLRGTNGLFEIDPHEPEGDRVNLSSINGYFSFCWGDCPGVACKSGVVMPTADLGFMIAETIHPGSTTPKYTTKVDPDDPEKTITVPSPVPVFGADRKLRDFADANNYRNQLPGNPRPEQNQ